MPPEEELLLCCVRTRVDKDTARRIGELVRGPLDWPSVVGAAIRHGVASLLYRTLDTVAREAVPPTTREQLSDRFQATTLQNRFLAAQLVEIRGLLTSDGLRGLAFKGPSLALAVYRDVSLRAFHDLDVLVDPSEFARAQSVLIRHGFRMAADHGWQGSFVRGGVCVDLHRALAPIGFPIGVDFQEYWRRRRVVRVDGTGIETFSAEDLLVVLAIQAAKDAWGDRLRLATICDIAELIAGSRSLDWALIERVATQMRVRDIVTFALGLARDFFGTPLPARFAARLTRNHAIVRAVAETRATLLDEGKKDDPSRLRGIEFHAHVRECLRDRLLPFWRRGKLLTPNAADYAFRPLPSWLSFLYYATRPFRLLRRYGGSVFRISDGLRG
jgi:hypothetical protein